MNLSPEACIAFEDSENGIRSTQGAKLKTIITVNGYTESHDFDGAVIVLDSFGEPDAPFNVLKGDGYNKDCLDIDLVKRLHQQS